MYSYSEDWAQAREPDGTTILNDFHSDQVNANIEGTVSSFPKFSLLPTELRLLIWKYVLQQHRLISITVVDKAHQAPRKSRSVQSSTRNSLGNVVSGECYKLQIATYHMLTPLLRANCESRGAALEFYRVHIPYDRGSHGERRYICFNPEFDYIHLVPEGFPEILASFVHDFKAYDPRSVGILYLGVGVGKPHDLELPMGEPRISVNGTSYSTNAVLCITDPSNLTSLVLSTFQTTLANLRRVFFHNVARWDSRMMFDSLDMQEVRFNRSYPICAVSEAFDFVGPDPRPIDADLDRVAIGWDPRSVPCLWRQMESRFGITRKSETTEFVYHISGPLFGKHPAIHSRNGAAASLQGEKEAWRSGWEKGGLFARFKYEDPDTLEKLKNAPISAFGFWVLPLDAFGEIPERDFEGIRWESKMVVSLEKHRPQLGVFRLPQEG